MSNSVAKTWANGLDLHLELSGTRVRAQLENALRDAVRSGRLGAGIRLPSSRTLAGDLGIARNTVAEVYSQLVAEGWLTARTGSGTSVAGHPAVAAASTEQAAGVARGPLRYDLRAGEPDVSVFPRGPWLAAARKALAAAPDRALGYPDPRGLMTLRSALAGYLARVRGVVAEPVNIVICSGFAHGLAVVAGALRAMGASTVAVEEYGHQRHRDIVTGRGLRLAPLPVDLRGAVIGAASGADAALLTPAHQFPLGVTLHPGRRRAAARWGGIVIEDDYDGEFRYDRQPVGAMQALAPDNVIYCGTASKSLAPGVRMGWLVVPPRLLDAVTGMLDGGPSALDQLALAEFIESGGYDRQIRRARLAYRRRRDRLVAALAPLGLRVSGVAAGLHAVLDFDAFASESSCLALAADHGLAIDGLHHYAFGGLRFGGLRAARSGLVIGYARPPEHAYTTALARLRAVLIDLALPA
jgi:GntR family transcriptional regulator/MocR family aminotransferase